MKLNYAAIAAIAAVMAALSFPAISSPKPEDPCQTYYDFLKRVERESVDMPSAEIYQGIPIKSYREGATFIHGHPGADLDDWMYDQYRLCLAGKIDPLSD